MFFHKLKDYIEAGRLELAIEAATFILIGLAYMDVLPSTIQIAAILASAFFLMLGVYSFNVVTDKDEDSVNKPNSAIVSGRQTPRQMFVFSLACKIVALIFALFINWAVFAVVLTIVLGSVIYSSKIVGGQRLKDIYLIKNFSTSFFWVLLLFLPMLAYDAPIPLAYFFVVFFVFTHDFISSMLSDLKDLDGDKRAGLKTFPTVHGLDATLKLLVIVNTLGIIALISGWLFFSLKVSMFLLPLIAISRYYVLWLVSSGQKSAYYVYDKFDRPTESSIGPLAIIGRLLIH